MSWVSTHGCLPGIKISYFCIEAATLIPWNVVHGRLPGSGLLPRTLRWSHWFSNINILGLINGWYRELTYDHEWYLTLRTEDCYLRTEDWWYLTPDPEDWPLGPLYFTYWLTEMSGSYTGREVHTVQSRQMKKVERLLYKLSKWAIIIISIIHSTCTATHTSVTGTGSSHLLVTWKGSS